ncbi:hypothetical protein CVU37_00325 [candidate division BRC1 bacterium HGW-BRC1-1]|nr:MAG: hypothetical protein CVU37_00325 [candidate division BRC1 bacterium HGW-BRC1-1]
MKTLRSKCLMAAALILACSAPGWSETSAPLKGALRFLHWNIEHGALHDAAGKGAGESMEAVADVIRKINPDVVSLVEVRNEGEARALGDAVGMYTAFGYTVENRQGNALLSRTPFISTQRHELPFKEWQKRVALEGRIQVDGSELALFAAHLTFNIRPDKQDQVMELMNLMKRTPGPKILAGDFNDMDDRPNGYSEAGFINMITGGHHGTVQGPEPKMFDFHRKCAVPEECWNNPPFFSLKTKWDEPGREANTISYWQPRVRIDHIFVSPEFYLNAPENKCEVVDVGAMDWKGKGEKGAAFVSDHKPVLAEIALPTKPARLFLDSVGTTTAVDKGEIMELAVGAVDANEKPVSLLQCDLTSPENDPIKTARIVGRVKWSVGGGIGRVEETPLAKCYAPMEKFDRPYAARATFHGDTPGTGTITAQVDGLSSTIDVVVLQPGQAFLIAKEPGK